MNGLQAPTKNPLTKPINQVHLSHQNGIIHSTRHHNMSSQSPLPSVTTKTVPSPAPNGMGNGLFATTDIKVGEDVVHAKVPFVAVLDKPRLDDTCSACFGKRQMETGTELKACTGCRVVKYCDRVSLIYFWEVKFFIAGLVDRDADLIYSLLFCCPECLAQLSLRKFVNFEYLTNYHTDLPS